VAEAYVQVVLIQAAYLSEMTAPQMDFAESADPHVGAQGAACRDSRGGRRGRCRSAWTRRSRSARARSPRPRSARTTAARRRGSSQSLRKRIHGLQNDEEPRRSACRRRIGGPALDQLQRLHQLWCEGAPPRPPAKVPT
jgi:hypothetical protein